MNKIIANLGTDDSVNTCDCCGKTNLKATVAFETESGDVVHYGVVCAARAMGKDAKAVQSETRTADNAKREAAREAAEQAHQASMKRWVAHLVSLTGGLFYCNGEPDICRMLQAAGGYAEAEKSFAG